MRELPRQLRVASPDTIEAALRKFIRTLPIEHTHRLPSALPVDARSNYFELVKRGPFWDAINNEGGLSLFIPAEFNEIKMKLVAVGAS